MRIVPTSDRNWREAMAVVTTDWHREALKTAKMLDLALEFNEPIITAVQPSKSLREAQQVVIDTYRKLASELRWAQLLVPANPSDEQFERLYQNAKNNMDRAIEALAMKNTPQKF